ncbi:hypothetical protein [Marinirhabdus gelatinilytica]|uniref:Uncharacterized protein n=1 Tax=Marinirhabdus gelatinilytica TaxID=1703343 RepID=A0A370QAH5_9FLAO|nr:hypothetical protein [Marinirhabdus gelatinilytica]RDK85371.1 hypothetical protein C8D94_103196 [Marinirhabdus gelatinilytica]
MPHGSLNAFKATLARKKARDRKKKSLFDTKTEGHNHSTEKTEYNFPKVSEEELEEIKEGIRRKFKNRRRKNLVVTLFFFLLFIFLFLCLLVLVP